MSSEATAAQPPSESTLFARTLKKYENTTIGARKETRNVIVEFDDQLFNRTCAPASPDYNEEKCNYDEIMAELFKEGEVWLSRELILKAIDSIAAMHGWTAAKDKENIICNRFGSVRSGTRDFSAGNLQANCSLIIKLKPLVKEKYFPESQVIRKWKYKPDWNQPVQILQGTCTKHGGHCEPGRQNRVAVMSRAGTYTKKTPHSALFSLCNIAEHCGKLTPSAIKNVMKVAWPSQKLVTKQNISYIRAKVMKLLPTLRKSNFDYEEFKKVVNCDDLLNGIDNEELDDDDAYQLAHTVWLDLLSTTDTKEEAIFSFIEYLNLIKCRAKGFTYKLAEEVDTSGKKKLVGVVWMTATMRRNFELFGGYISLDMMKRGLNTLLWPYCAVTMYDEHMKICVACEGILCGEREDMYKFIAQFLSQSAPGRPLSEVNIVAGDGFFDQEMIVEMGFIKAQYITDRWHLLDSGLCKRFGKRAYELLQQHLKEMVNAPTEEKFEEVLSLAKERLQAEQPRDMQMEKNLEEFAKIRNTYAQYLIAQVPGNLNRHGSSISESNHSSVLVYVNDGNKTGNVFCEDANILIKELLQRQKKHSTEKNKVLFGDRQKMKSVVADLEHRSPTDDRTHLLNAARELNLPTYQRFQSFYERESNYVAEDIVLDPARPDLVSTAVRSNVGEEPPRVFHNETSRCGCGDQLAHEDMCVHEIVAHGGYRREMFLPRHFVRHCVTGSTNGPPTSVTEGIDDILGYEEEVIPDFFGTTNEDDGGGDDMIGAVDIHGNDVSTLPTLPTLPPPQVPAPKPGQLPSKSLGKVQPLRKQMVKNILTSAADSYSSMSEEEKYAISNLVLQIQELTVAHDSTTVTSRSGVSVAVPSNACITTQPKNRMMPLHEVVAKKQKTSSQSSNLLAGTTHTLAVNPTTRSIKCSFCMCNHTILSCSRKQQLRSKATEYELTKDYPAQEQSLRNRLEEMPVTEGGGKGSSPFSSIDKEYLPRNFIIHGARSMEDNSRIWCISFIGKDGEVMASSLTEKIWIDATAMNQLVTHTKKVKKYVYDETITLQTHALN